MAFEKWAVVTGSSGGLGVELARGVVERGYSVVLVARSVGPMHQLADELRRSSAASVVVEPIDLSEAGSAIQLEERLDVRGVRPSLLINNAGVGMNERFIEHDPVKLSSMLQLNIVNLTELSLRFGRRMATQGGGRILLVASLTAYQPSPWLAAYAASKAYVLSLGEALHVELAPQVGVTVLSPGLMDTGFNEASGFRTPPSMRRFVSSPADVASIGLDALFAGKPSVVAGRANQVLAFSTRLMSRHLAATLNADVAKPSQAHG